MISEAASRKRGRPAILPPWWQREIHGCKTERAQQNQFYAFLGLEAIGAHTGSNPEQRFAWLVDWRASNQNVRGAVKIGVLAEIGRISEQHGDEVAQRAAAAICRLAPATIKEAEAKVRRWRLSVLDPIDRPGWRPY